MERPSPIRTSDGHGHTFEALGGATFNNGTHSQKPSWVLLNGEDHIPTHCKGLQMLSVTAWTPKHQTLGAELAGVHYNLSQHITVIQQIIQHFSATIATVNGCVCACATRPLFHVTACVMGHMGQRGRAIQTQKSRALPSELSTLFELMLTLGWKF